MIQTIAIHGRQPGLGRAELESLYGPENIHPVTSLVTGISLPSDQIEFQRLGGTVKLAKALALLPTTDFNKLIDYITEKLPEHLGYIPEGKIQFGLSLYDVSASVSNLNAAVLSVKKVIKAAGRSVRVVPNKELALKSAQVLHNHLTGPTGMELLLVRQGNATWLAQTVHIQDIEAYAARDQARPKRDAKVGMLPPKLAQTIINLATGPASQDPGKIEISDPFCGTGVVLQEATLMGYSIHGADIEPRMIEYTRENLDWIFQTKASWELDVRDATVEVCPGNHIACETYLGRPFSALPKPEVLTEVLQDVNTIHYKFLQNVARKTETCYRMCIAVPAWKTKSGFKHLRILDSLEELGYTRMKFVHVSNDELIYHRENQIVGRELVVLTRK